jgi:uncharacterized membrane protein
MSHVRHSILIEAPPEHVWAIGRDPERMPEWNTTVVSVKDAEGPLDVPGARLTVVSKIAGRPLDITWHIEEVETPRFFVATATTPLGGSARQRVDYEPEGTGTRVTIDMEYEIAAGILGQVLSKAFAERAIERDVHHSAENLKALAEEAATVAVT